MFCLSVKKFLNRVFLAVMQPVEKCKERLVFILQHWCWWNFGWWNFISDSFCYTWCLSVCLLKIFSAGDFFPVLTESSYCFFSFFYSYNLGGTCICTGLVAIAPNNFKTQKMPRSMCSKWHHSLRWWLKIFQTSHLNARKIWHLMTHVRCWFRKRTTAGVVWVWWRYCRGSFQSGWPSKVKLTAGRVALIPNCQEKFIPLKYREFLPFHAWNIALGLFFRSVFFVIFICSARQKMQKYNFWRVRVMLDKWKVIPASLEE